MAKVKTVVKMMLNGGGANPAPPVGSMLGPHGINMMDFCKQFNAQTQDRKGETVPVEVTIFEDRKFTFKLKTRPTSELIRDAAKIKKGSSLPHSDKVGKITWQQVEEIAQIKMPDLNATSVEQAKKIIAGSARSMGVDVVDA